MKSLKQSITESFIIEATATFPKKLTLKKLMYVDADSLRTTGAKKNEIPQGTVLAFDSYRHDGYLDADVATYTSPNHGSFTFTLSQIAALKNKAVILESIVNEAFKPSTALIRAVGKIGKSFDNEYEYKYKYRISIKQLNDTYKIKTNSTTVLRRGGAPDIRPILPDKSEMLETKGSLVISVEFTLRKEGITRYWVSPIVGDKPSGVWYAFHDWNVIHNLPGPLIYNSKDYDI